MGFEIIIGAFFVGAIYGFVRTVYRGIKRLP